MTVVPIFPNSSKKIDMPWNDCIRQVKSEGNKAKAFFLKLIFLRNENGGNWNVIKQRNQPTLNNS